MTVSEYYSKFNRTPDFITMQVKDVVDSFLTFSSAKLNKEQSLLIDKLKTLDIQITNQTMHILEAPLDRHDFKDLVKQLIENIMSDLIEKAIAIGILSLVESELIIVALDESFELEFCEIYNGATLI